MIILKILNELKAEERKIFLQTKLINFQTIKTYKSKRHLKGFPSNGQRTSTNARNAKSMANLIQNLNKFI
jgi:ribosomal protein S13